jgi:hypothetical protein
MEFDAVVVPGRHEPSIGARGDALLAVAVAVHQSHCGGTADKRR